MSEQRSFFADDDELAGITPAGTKQDDNALRGAPIHRRRRMGDSAERDPKAETRMNEESRNLRLVSGTEIAPTPDEWQQRLDQRIELEHSIDDAVGGATPELRLSCEVVTPQSLSQRRLRFATPRLPASRHHDPGSATCPPATYTVGQPLEE
jgi:hypothetical protein